MLAEASGEFLSKGRQNFPSVATGDPIFPVHPFSLRRHLREVVSPAGGASMVGPVGRGRERKVGGEEGTCCLDPY